MCHELHRRPHHLSRPADPQAASPAFASTNASPPALGEAIESIYRWKGQIEEAMEFPLLLKTRADLFETLSTRVKAEHPYEVPCIIATEIAAIDPAYAKWLEEETG